MSLGIYDFSHAGSFRSRNGRTVVGSSQQPPPPPMRVLEARVFRGPSIYAYRTVIRIKLALGELEHWPTDRLGDFSDRLLAAMPTLHEHTCSYDAPGGFVRRLREGTWLGHVVEHLAIELQQLAGVAVTYGKTRSA